MHASHSGSKARGGGRGEPAKYDKSRQAPGGLASTPKAFNTEGDAVMAEAKSDGKEGKKPKKDKEAKSEKKSEKKASKREREEEPANGHGKEAKGDKKAKKEKKKSKE